MPTENISKLILKEFTEKEIISSKKTNHNIRIDRLRIYIVDKISIV